MKKLMILLAAGVSAMFANAAAIQWNTGNLVDYNGAVLNKSTLYTATVYFYSDSEGANNISANFAGTLTDTSSDKNGNYSAQTKDSGIASGTYWTKVVIEGNGYKLESDIVSLTYDSDAISPLAIKFLDGQNLSAKAIDQSGSLHGWQSVPEPTSGLLLLLGVAGLALRRRRA